MAYAVLFLNFGCLGALPYNTTCQQLKKPVRRSHFWLTCAGGTDQNHSHGLGGGFWFFPAVSESFLKLVYSRFQLMDEVL